MDTIPKYVIKKIRIILIVYIHPSVRPNNKFESQGESIQDSCKTSNDVRCRDVGSEESTREEVGCGGNEDVKMDEWSHQAGQN